MMRSGSIERSDATQHHSKQQGRAIKYRVVRSGQHSVVQCNVLLSRSTSSSIVQRSKHTYREHVAGRVSSCGNLNIAGR